MDGWMSGWSQWRTNSNPTNKLNELTETISAISRTKAIADQTKAIRLFRRRRACRPQDRPGSQGQQNLQSKIQSSAPAPSSREDPVRPSPAQSIGGIRAPIGASTDRPFARRSAIGGIRAPINQH